MNHPPLEGLKILVVDDDLDSIDLFSFILQTEEAEVIPATSVQEALIAVKEFQPDIILSDLHMPETDGFTFVRQIRELFSHVPSIPIIAVSAFVAEGARLQALSAGFQEYLTKPINPDDLVGTISRWVGKS